MHNPLIDRFILSLFPLEIEITILPNISQAVLIRIKESLHFFNVGIFQRTANRVLEHNKYIILDIRELTYISAAGWEALSAFHLGLKQKQGKLILTGLSPGLERIFEKLGLYDYFILAHDMSEALHIIYESDD